MSELQSLDDVIYYFKTYQDIKSHTIAATLLSIFNQLIQ